MKGKSEVPNNELQFAPDKRVIWGVLFLFWLVLGGFSASLPLLELFPMRRRRPVSLGWLGPTGILFLLSFLTWLLWAALAPVPLWLRRRLPLAAGTLWRALPVHLFAVAGLCAVHSVLVLVLRWLFSVTEAGTAFPIDRHELLYQWLSDLPFCTLFYGLVLGIGSALDYYRQFRERELRASQLEAQLAQAQLQMLKMQLHPHFLFNTLNGITGLVRDHDNAAAIQMLVGLSELLRQTLEKAGQQEVRLSEELEWLELYLKLQQMRFSDRLQVQLDVAPETLDALVPNLITQPLVENAIRHGLAPRAAPGTVALSAHRQGERLELCISDDGVGLPDGWRWELNQGVGLANTAARLRQHFGTDFQFELERRATGGIAARLSIPLRRDMELR